VSAARVACDEDKVNGRGRRGGGGGGGEDARNGQSLRRHHLITDEDEVTTNVDGREVIHAQVGALDGGGGGGGEDGKDMEADEVLQRSRDEERKETYEECIDCAVYANDGSGYGESEGEGDVSYQHEDVPHVLPGCLHL